MRNIMLFITAITFSACITQTQLIELQSTNNNLQNNNFAHSDSLISMNYNFYSRDGVIQFTIQNKSDRPLYIDWKNSSFIISKDKIYQYWEDEAEIQASENQYSGFLYGNIYKKDRITFLPPKTEITNDRFKLANGTLYFIGSTQIISEPKNWRKTTKTTEILVKNYSQNNTPLKIRNYITISTTEDFKNPIHYDFEFWISKIQQMDSRQLVGYDPSYSFMDSVTNSQYHLYKQNNRYFIWEK